MQIKSAALLALVAVVQSIAVPSSHVVHEERGATSSKWIKREKIARSKILPVHVGLTQFNLDKGEEFLMDV